MIYVGYQNQIKSKQIKPNQTKTKRIKTNQIKLSNNKMIHFREDPNLSNRHWPYEWRKCRDQYISNETQLDVLRCLQYSHWKGIIKHVEYMYNSFLHYINVKLETCNLFRFIGNIWVYISPINRLSYHERYGQLLKLKEPD